MHREYKGVVSRFLRPDERLIVSDEQEMPLVIEPAGSTSLPFLKQFLVDNSTQIIDDLAHYGAVLLRGFDVETDEDFEQTVLSIPEFKGISEAFMSENGRDPVGSLKYVLHTNTIYKTGGTLYLGGFHTENYYSADVPGYISFFCAQPSALGGETGIINTEKLYKNMDEALKHKLEEQHYFVGKWLVKDVAQRYGIEVGQVLKVAQHFNLPLVGEGDDALILMYKPCVFLHPHTQEKALQINLFELPTLNKELRKVFMNDYPGKTWFWHRFFWKLPTKVFDFIEFMAVVCIAFFHSPQNSYKIVRSKWQTYAASKHNKSSAYSTLKAGSCFNDSQIKDLAQSMRANYSSCLWKKGDILLIDNRKVMHAGMPGIGPRLIRALICNPIAMEYAFTKPGWLDSKDRTTDTIGAYMSSGTFPE
ncbi:MAG: TauD/TfdA family dioxygenase [Legionellales bacterium]